MGVCEKNKKITDYRSGSKNPGRHSRPRARHEPPGGVRIDNTRQRLKVPYGRVFFMNKTVSRHYAEEIDIDEGMFV